MTLLNGLNFLSTQCEVIKSTPVLAGALHHISPGDSREATDQKIDDLKANLVAEPGKKDDLIRVSLGRLDSPGEAAAMVSMRSSRLTSIMSASSSGPDSIQMLQLLRMQMLRECQAEARQTRGQSSAGFSREKS